jgi:Zn-finger nucleic acid-binding protein
MNCPSCSAEMTAQTLEGHLGTGLQVDFCGTCQVFWFDHFESLQLAPAATLGLFRMISDCKAAPRALSEPLACPRCDLRLLLTNDRQRNTAFKYWRCPREHGRLISYFDFLREKDFIHPLSPAQLAELRQNVQTINCSNCGAPIDLMHSSECSHCGTPVSMIDVKQISDVAAQLKDAARPKPAVDMAALVLALKADRHDAPPPTGLVEAGLTLISRWLTSS